jgi:hypothetical protein
VYDLLVLRIQKTALLSFLAGATFAFWAPLPTSSRR